MGRILGLLALAPILLGVAIPAAREFGGEVVELTTFEADDTRFVTSVWIAEIDGKLWIRGGDAEAGWVQRLREHPEAKLTRYGQTLDVEAAFVERYAAEINRAMREKYGWADRVVSVIHDSDHVLAIRLLHREF